MSLQIDKNRKKILECDDDILVIGGAGSGKTTIALSKAFNFIKNKNLNKGQKILFLSFSRNAKSRIEESASYFEEYKELRSKLYIQTFHAFFYEIIKTHGYLLGIQKKISILPPHDVDALKGDKDETSSEWIAEKNKYLLEDGKVIFDDFALIMLKIIRKSKRIREMLINTYPLIIVDEAQDTDKNQWDIIKEFYGKPQFLFLGDLDQQIFSYRETINEERLNEVKEFFKPKEFSFSSQNFRSPDTDILKFATDVLKQSISGKYEGVSLFGYSPKAENRDKWIRQSVGYIKSLIKKKTGKLPKSIAILTPYNMGVKQISKALKNGANGEISHRVQFDEVATNLSSRLIACFLEPIMDKQQHLLFVLHIFKDFYSAKKSQTQLKKYITWINKSENGINISGKVVPFLKEFINHLKEYEFTGNPAKDWVYVQNKLLSCGVPEINKFVTHSQFLIAFNRGANNNE